MKNQLVLRKQILKEKHHLIKNHMVIKVHEHKGNALPSALCIELPKMNAYAKYFDKNSKPINLLVYDKELLQKIQ